MKRSVVLFRDRMVTNCLLLCSRGIVTPCAAFVKRGTAKEPETAEILANNFQKVFHNCRSWCKIQYNVPALGRETAVDAEAHKEGGKVRCRYPGRTIEGIPARSARMTAEFERRKSLPASKQRWDSSVADAPSEGQQNRGFTAC